MCAEIPRARRDLPHISCPHSAPKGRNGKKDVLPSTSKPQEPVSQLSSTQCCSCLGWYPESPSSTREGSSDKLPAYSSPLKAGGSNQCPSHWVKNLQPCSYTTFCCFSWGSCPKAEWWENWQTSFSILAEAQDISSATHPNSSSCTVNLTPHMTLVALLPLRTRALQEHYCLLSKLSVYINPSPFREEVYKQSTSCYSTTTVTFQTAKAITKPSKSCCSSISF